MTIPLGVAAFLGGLYCLSFAFRAGHRMPIWSGALYAAAGSAAMICGVIFALLPLAP